MKFHISPYHFNAIMACAASGDVRQQLNTFFIDYGNLRMVATNGHILGMASIEKTEDNPMATPEEHDGSLVGFAFQALVRPISTIGKVVTIDTYSSELEYEARDGLKRIRLFRYGGDTPFPDYIRILALPSQRGSIHEIGLRPEALAKPLRWCNLHTVSAHLRFNGEREPMYVTYQHRELYGLEVTFMPSRIREGF